MTLTPDARRIRTSTLAELRDYYNELARTADSDSITAQLLQAVERGSIPPLAFAPWLGVSKSPSVIREALRQRVSVSIRKFAIKQLRLVFSSSRWKEVWDGVGGTAGLLDIFSDLSVLEIPAICKALGRQGRHKQNIGKSECLTELFKSLQPDWFSDAPYKTKDRRPLAKYYALLIPSCSGDFVEEAVANGMDGVWKHARTQDLLRYHPKSIQKQLLRFLSDTPTQHPIDHQKLESLLVQNPSRTSTMRGFSASMEFSLSVLRQIVKTEVHVVEDDFFIRQLVQPLLRRAVKKRLDWGAIQEIVSLTMKYLETHPSAQKELSTTVGDVLHLVAKCWTQEPDLFEMQLRRLCSLSMRGKTERLDLWLWATFLDGMPISQRYQLLRLCYQESASLDLDVDADLERVQGPFSSDLLTNLGYKQAFLLFTRLRRVRGDVGLVKSQFALSVLSPSSDYEGRMQGWNEGIPDLYQFYLMNLNGDYQQAEELAAEYLGGRKRKAKFASQPEQRAFYAKHALFASIACGSLTLLRETLEWTRRFIRDPLVMCELYRYSFPREAVRLLSGVPANLAMPLTVIGLQERVEAANSILEHIFATVCAALREPSFCHIHWQGALNLFWDVIRKRIELTPKLTNRLKLSEDELYGCLWEATIPMLLRVEEKGNQEGHERLGADSLKGIYQYAHGSDLHTNGRTTRMFVDNFAQARNELWCKLRPKVYPAVTTLPAPFPRGLAIQHLIPPWGPSSQPVDDRTPYLASRVTAALFPDPSVALQPVPSDDDSHQAFGNFVDSYSVALQLYIPESCPKEERRKRVQKAWDYAVGTLSHGRLTEEEAIRFWREKKPKYLEEWPPKSVVNSRHVTWPLIPEPDSPREPCEWNPLISGRPAYAERDLGDPTYMDLSVADAAKVVELYPDKTIHQTMSMKHAKVPAHQEDPNVIWDAWRDMGEGGILSALLYLDAKYVSNDHLLAAPFPSEKDARYPVLYLDEDFLSREDLDPRKAARGIRGHLNLFPPVLLAQFARSLIAVLDAADPDSSTYVTLHEVAMLLIVRLGESDRPALATKPAIDTIMGKTESSSWHRQLLKSKLLQRLSASDAQSCMEKLSDSIIRVLQANKDEEVETKLHDAPGTSRKPPFVKITTVKLLTQLLRIPGLFETEYAISVFSTLLEKTSHIDVHLKVAEGLLGILKSGSSEQSNDALTILESAIPLAGALDERHSLTEADWVLHEEQLSLPELQKNVQLSYEDDSPVLSALLAHFAEAPNDENELQPFVNRILLPILKHLEEHTARWTALFLRKYGLDDVAQAELQIPSVPRDIGIVSKHVLGAGSRLRCLPGILLEKYVSYLTFVIAPPPPIRALNKRLDNDASLNSQQEVKTWLHMYGQGLKILPLRHGLDITSMLDHIADSPKDTGITPRLIQEQFLKLFTTTLLNDSPTYYRLKKCVSRTIVYGQLISKPWWPLHGKPIVEAMISYVDSLRTREWERDPNRTPTVLPDTFPWRILLLDFPWPQPNDKYEYNEEKCKLFASQLNTIIDEISGSNAPHTAFPQLTYYLAIDPVAFSHHRPGKRNVLREALMNNRILTAVYLGDITKTRLSWLTAPEIMRVDVAVYLVGQCVGKEGMKVVDVDLNERLKDMLARWKMCENEGVRRKAWEVEESHLP
jgi:hypothetical protein